MKKFKALNFGLLLILAIAILALLPFNNSVAFATDEESLSLEELVYEMFGDNEILSAEYLYNFDDAPDYIYINSTQGYAVYLSDTLELSEYSTEGCLPYPEGIDRAYYAGPGNYYIKRDENFINVVTDDEINITLDEANFRAASTLQLFSAKSKRDADVDSIRINNYNNVMKSNHYPDDPKDFEYGSLPGTEGAEYISNYEYFFNDPKHGYNDTGVCSAVAAQLLLSYNNYYNDRRIIPEKYLNGWDSIAQSVKYSEYSPNYCENPMKMTSLVLGSSGYKTTDDNTYFKYVVSNIPASSSVQNVESGMQKILNERSQQTDSNINFTTKLVDTKYDGTVDSKEVIKEIDDGRPLYLALRAPSSKAHAVVAYGYQNKNSTDGYITHFGWESNYNNVWVNSVWCYSYITLKINHTHNYSILLESGETRCNECNHRTNAFTVKNINNKSTEIIGVNVPLVGDKVIPNSLDDRNVTKIGDSAFANQKLITSVTLPSTVTTIGNSAFQNCEKMRNVYFDDLNNLMEIGSSAFAGSGIRNFTFTSKIKKIAANTFQGSNVTEIIFNEDSTLEVIEDYAFDNCMALSSITLPSTLTSIGAHAFANCCNIRPNIFNEASQLKSIGDSAFYGCEAFVLLTIPTSVTTIGKGAFENCSTLVSVTYDSESTITDINNSTFAGCKALNGVSLPAGLKRIGANAFANSALPTINILKTVTTIESGAFADCSRLAIYTEYGSKPTGWSSNWNKTNRYVIWGCKFAFNPYSYVVSFVKSSSNPTASTGDISNPFNKTSNFLGWYTTSDFTGTKYEAVNAAPNGTLYAKWEGSCIAEGTLITLADGSQVAVEELKGDETLLVWNMFTGQFDASPILFIDKDPQALYDVINLSFSDGTAVRVISEHAFWDFDLNKYVYLREDADKYIGHWFNKQIVDSCCNEAWDRVQLVGVTVSRELTTAWSPVTYGHLCYYVNGMLSMPGGIDGLINVLDVDQTTMAYDVERMTADIEEYGLFTYDEFAELVAVPEYVFDAIGGQYLKIAIGKGIVDVDRLESLFERYQAFFEM